MKKIIRSFRPIYPTPAAMITCVSETGVPNIITLGEVFNISLAKPPIVGIAIRKVTYSHGLISNTREFAINMPSRSLLEQTDYCGAVSGRDIDKFKSSGLTPVPASIIQVPLIAECPINLECRCISIQEVGDHDLFLGEVVKSHADESVLGVDGNVDYAKLESFCFMFHYGSKAEYWSIGEKLSDAFFMRKKIKPR